MTMDCRNCDGRKCMSCVFREWHNECVDDCPECCVPSTLVDVPNLGDEYTPAEATLNRIFARLSQRIGAIIMTSADKAVQDVTAQLTKAKGEIDAEVAKLQDAGVSAESLAGLQAVSQSLDDANPDATPAEPTPAADAPVDGATDTST